MKGFKSTLIFAALIAGLVGYTYYEFERGKSEEKKKEEKAKLFKFEGKEVSLKRVLVSAEGKEIELTKGNNGSATSSKSSSSSEGAWQLVKPVADRTDEYTADSYATSLLELKGDEVAGGEGEPVNWSEFGFNQPLGTVELTDSKGKMIKLTVGAEPAFDGRYYVRINDEPKLWVADASIRTDLTKKVSDLREKKLFRREASSAQSFALKMRGQTALKFKKENDNWVLDGDSNFRVDQEAVRSLIEAAQGLRATDFVDGEVNAKVLSEKKLSSSDIEVELGFASAKGETQQPNPWVLKVGEALGDKRYALSSDDKFLFELSSTAISSLQKKKSDFRDKAFPFKFDKQKVQQLMASNSLGEVNLKRTDKGWELIGGEAGKEADSGSVNKLLDQVAELTVDEYLGSRELKTKKAEYKLVDKEGKTVFQMQWGDAFKIPKAGDQKTKQDVYLVKTSLANEALAVAVNRLDSLPMQTLKKDKAKTPSAADVLPETRSK